MCKCRCHHGGVTCDFNKEAHCDKQQIHCPECENETMVTNEEGLDRLLEIFKQCLLGSPDMPGTLTINPDHSWIMGFTDNVGGELKAEADDVEM